MRLPGLDGLRAVSISMVILFHVSTTAARHESMGFGAFGVDIFFVLSGYLITWLLIGEEREDGAISLRAFYMRRALRILPPAATYLAVLAILSAARVLAATRSEILSCLFFVRNVMPGGFQTVHFWTLSLEEQFYLVWPLTIILLRSNRARLITLAGLLVASPLWHVLNYRLAGGAEFVNHARFDLRCDPMLVGCFLALARADDKFLRYLRSPWFQCWWLPLIALGCLVVALRQPYLLRVAYVSVALLINYVVEHPGGLLNWAPVVWLGQLSYSLYIWQQLFCWKSSLTWLGHFPQNVIASLCAAALSYYLIEKPLAKIRSRIRTTLRRQVLNPANELQVQAE